MKSLITAILAVSFSLSTVAQTTWSAQMENYRGADAAALPPAPSHYDAPLSWWGALGTHYRLAPEAYLGTTRSYPTPSKWSFLPDVTALAPENIEPSIGKFSGEKRYYDFTGIVERPHNFDYSRYLRDAIASHADLIWNIGEINHPDKEHVALVMAKKGAYLKDLIYAAVCFSESGEFKNKPMEVYWEVGNEINSYRRFALFEKGSQQNNLEKTNDYVEYFLAPTIEAIRAASQDMRGDPRAVKILLGNVMMPDVRATKNFIGQILETTIKGEHAPSLAGKKVHELVDAMGLHYTDGKHNVLGAYYEEWVASGKVPAIWNTEELGNTGLGDYDVARVAFRWLTFWTEKPWNKNTARLIFWGDRGEKDPADPTKRKDGLYSETTGRDMLQHLGQFLQDHPLSSLQASIDYKYSSNANLETYGLRAKVSERKTKVAILAIPSSDITIDSFTIKNTGKRITRFNAYVQPIRTHMEAASASFTHKDGTLAISKLSLNKEQALLLEFEYEE